MTASIILYEIVLPAICYCFLFAFLGFFVLVLIAYLIECVENQKEKKEIECFKCKHFSKKYSGTVRVGFTEEEKILADIVIYCKLLGVTHREFLDMCAECMKSFKEVK